MYAILSFLAFLVLSTSSFSMNIRIDEPKGIRGDLIQIPIQIEDSNGITSFTFDMAYPSTALRFRSVKKEGSLSQAFLLVDGNEIEPGLIRIAGAAFVAPAIKGSGILIIVELEIRHDAPDLIAIEFRDFLDDLAGIQPIQSAIHISDGFEYYFTDFENMDTPGTEWGKWQIIGTKEISRPNPIMTTPSGDHFIGYDNNRVYRLTLPSLPPHTRIVVKSDLYLIMSWDGNSTEWGPDRWGLREKQSGFDFLATFSTNSAITQSFPNLYPGKENPALTGVKEINVLGYQHSNQPMDAIYRLSFAFSHSTSDLIVEFYDKGLQSIDDETWGIDNVKIILPDAEPLPGILDYSLYE